MLPGRLDEGIGSPIKHFAPSLIFLNIYTNLDSELQTGICNSEECPLKCCNSIEAGRFGQALNVADIVEGAIALNSEYTDSPRAGV